MRRAIALLLLPALTACTSSGTARPGKTATPTPDVGHVLQCGMYDTGTVYLNDVWPQITTGQSPAGLDVSLTKTADNWQTIIKGSPGQHDALAADVTASISAIHDLQAAIDAGRGGAPVATAGNPVQAVRDAYAAVAGDCRAVGYTLTQKLGA